MQSLTRLSWALELYGNIPLTQKFLEQCAISDRESLLEQVSQTHFRRYMSEETRPVYLLPAIKSVLREQRRIFWVMMGGDTNHFSWQALTELFGINLSPLPIKVKVGGPHHGDIDDPASYILSLLPSEAGQQHLAPATASSLHQWLHNLPVEGRDHLQKILQGRSISTLADFTMKDVIATLICVGVHPQLKARWYEVVPRYLDILKSFNATDLKGMSFDKTWFRGQILESNDILQRVRKLYERKVNEQGRDPSYIDADNFDLLRHAFSEILGEQVVELKKVGFQSWYMEGLNILLHDTELAQTLQQKTLFWENGIWTGRTYLGLAFATHAFYRHADWKFGVHTCYPYIPNIASLVDIQTSRTLEGIEDVQGLGKYIRISSSNGYRLVTYEDWLAEQERQFASADSSSIRASFDRFHSLIQRLIGEVRPTYATELQRFAPTDLLVKIYLREEDVRNPNEDHITFKHFLHLLYFDCLAKVSYRGVYFQLQRFFTDLLGAEKCNSSSTIFQELREMNLYLQPFDEVAMVKNWLVYRSFAAQQVHAGIEAITRHWQSVQGYLADDLPFEKLVQEIIPDVSRIDISKYNGRTHLPTFEN